MRMISGLMAGAALMAAGAADAADDRHFQLDTAADLVALCSSTPDHPNHSAAIHMCHGFLVGMNQMHAAMARALDGGVYCLPETLPSRNAVVADFVAWMGEHPELAGGEAVDAALAYGADTYPCN